MSVEMEKHMRKMLYCTALLVALALAAPVSAGPRSDAIAKLGIGFTLPDAVSDGVLDVNTDTGCVSIQSDTNLLNVCRIDQPDQTVDYPGALNGLIVSKLEGIPVPGLFARDRAGISPSNLVVSDAYMVFTSPNDSTQYQLQTFSAETRNGQTMWVVAYLGARNTTTVGQDVALMEATLVLIP